MALLRNVQHGGLGLRGVGRLPLVASWNASSAAKGSGIQQGHGILASFRKPCSVARRTATTAISDLRICYQCGHDALSLFCVRAVFQHRKGVPLCAAGLPRLRIWQAVGDQYVVGALAGTGSSCG